MMDIFGDARGCNSTSGRFHIYDIRRGRHHRLKRLWLVYEFYCEDIAAPVIGEIRYGLPSDPGDLLVGPRTIRWPKLPVGGVASVIGVRLVNTSRSPLSIDSTHLDGSSDLSIRLDECSGMTLVSNESCAVWVRFVPTTEGREQATLTITEPGGETHTTRFHAVVRGTADGSPVAGRPGAAIEEADTSFHYDSDPGEYVGQGESHTYDLSNADFIVEGSHHHMYAQIFGDDGETWNVYMFPTAGDIFAPGLVFPSTERGPGRGSAALDVDGDSRGCNTSTGSYEIHAIRDDDFGNLLSCNASFVLHCEGLQPALRGSFSYRYPSPRPTPSPYPH